MMNIRLHDKSLTLKPRLWRMCGHKPSSPGTIGASLVRPTSKNAVDSSLSGTCGFRDGCCRRTRPSRLIFAVSSSLADNGTIAWSAAVTRPDGS